MSINTIIELKDLKRYFKAGDTVVKALDGINLQIHEGEFVVILGPSGSGKTTLLNQIGGIDKPSEGEVIVAGKNITKLKDKELTAYRAKTIGWVFQFFNLIPSLTAIENVMLGLELAGDTRNMEERARELLAVVGLEGKEDRFPAHLSGGEQQRVALSRAMVKKPKIIVADEPTGNLDHKTGLEVVDLMKSLNKKEGITIVTVTHDTSLISFADRVLYLQDGKIIKEEIPSAKENL